MNLIDFDDKRLIREKHRLRLVGVVNTVVQVGTWHWRENRERIGQVLGAWQKAFAPVLCPVLLFALKGPHKTGSW